MLKPLLNDLYTTLLATEAAVRSGSVPPQTDTANRVRGEAGRLPVPLRGMLESLVNTSASQAAGVTREQHRRPAQCSRRQCLPQRRPGPVSVHPHVQRRCPARRLRATVRGGRLDRRLLPEESGATGRHVEKAVDIQAQRRRNGRGRFGIARGVPVRRRDTGRVLSGRRAHTAISRLDRRRESGSGDQGAHAGRRRAIVEANRGRGRSIEEFHLARAGWQPPKCDCKATPVPHCDSTDPGRCIASSIRRRSRRAQRPSASRRWSISADIPSRSKSWPAACRTRFVCASSRPSAVRDKL